MKFSGNLSKMHSELRDVVHYTLSLGNDILEMNDLIGKAISIKNLHQINCIKCGNVTKTSFAQGYCYPCFITSPETEDCVLRPELCRAHEGIARDIDFATGHCLIDHFVYLALSGGLKVGITRHTQLLTRWIDQGADKAIAIARTPNRYLAGCIEVALKSHLRDKTNWRLMLCQKEPSQINLFEERDKANEWLHPNFSQYIINFYDNITEINYPVLEFPTKVKSINLDKTEDFCDILTGIKGQYLMFKTGFVINVRKHSGYLVEIIA